MANIANGEIKVKLSKKRNRKKDAPPYGSASGKSVGNMRKPPFEHRCQDNGNTDTQQDSAQYICREMHIAVQAGEGNQECQDISCDTGSTVVEKQCGSRGKGRCGVSRRE